MRRIGAWVLGLVLFGVLAGPAGAQAPRLFGEGAVAKRAPQGATPVRLQEASTLRAMAGESLDIAAPGQPPLMARYVRHRELPEGRLLWEGRVATEAGRRPVVLVFGADGGFGVVPDAEGTLWATKSHAAGESWLEPLNPVRPDPVCPPKGCGPLPATDVVPVAAPKSGPALRMSDEEAEKAGEAPSRIDVLGIYTDDVVRITGSEDAAETYYLSLVALANQAFADSGVNARYEVVAMVRSAHDTSIGVQNTLSALRQNQLSDGLDVYALRDQHAADLVAMLSDGATNRELGGIAQITISPTNIPANYGYSNSAAGGYVMAHELGHNLGAAHDRETDTDSLGNVGHGAYDFGHGYRESGPYPFYTIMAYAAAGQAFQPLHSSPELWQCRGRPCGVAAIADNVRALNLMAPRIARLREESGSLSLSDVEVVESDSRSIPVGVRVRLSEPAGPGGLAVRVWAEDGSARAGEDFEPLMQDVSIAEGQYEATVTMWVLPDQRLEPTETFTLHAQRLDNEGRRASAAGLIVNDDPRVRLAGRLLFEGAAPPDGPLFVYVSDTTFRLGDESVQVFPPDFEYDIGVLPGYDYNVEVDASQYAPFGSATTRVSVGETSQRRDLVVKPRANIEGRVRFEGAPAPTQGFWLIAWGIQGQENSGTGVRVEPPDFAFAFTAAPGARLRLTANQPPVGFAPAEAVVEDTSLVSNPVEVVFSQSPTLRVDNATVEEPGPGANAFLVFEVKLASSNFSAANISWGDISFRWRIVGGTASAGEDYVVSQGEGLLPRGRAETNFRVTVSGDDVPEPDETIEVEIYDVAGARVADGRARGTLRDDDTPVPPAIGLLDATTFEGDAGSRALTFTARLDKPASAPVRFDVATRAGTAIAGSDFTATTLRGLQIAAGQVEARFSVPVLGDTAPEPGEHFFVELSNVTGATVAWPVVRGRILDDDGALPEAVAPAPGWLAVASDAGHHDLSLSNLPALPDARFRASALVQPLRSQAPLAAGAATLTWLDIPAVAGEAEFIVHATVEADAGASLRLLAGADAGQSDPGDASAACSRASTDGMARCELRVRRAAGAAATRYWVRVRNEGTATDVATTFAVVPLAGNASFIATGPGQLPAGAPFDVRLAWDDPRWLPGESRLGYVVVEARAGERVYFEPVRFERSGSVDAARVLLPGVPQALSLAPGATHSRVMLTLPPYATGLRVASQAAEGSGGSVRLEAVHLATPDGPAIAPAPAGAALAVSTGQGLSQTLQLSAAALAGREGRWYIRVVNTGNQRVDLSLLAEPTMGANAAPVTPGSYFNPQRGGHGLFLYPAGNQWAGLWYTYLEDRTPTWYYMQAAAPGADGLWHGKVYRAAWNGQGNHLTEIGDMLVTPGRDGGFSLAVRMDGYSSEQTMAPFLTGCPSVGGAPLDASAHWFEPALSGYGYSVQVHPNYEFVAAFIYDELGRPRFLSAERGGAFDANAGTLPLYQLRGFGPLAPYQAPDRVEVGSLQRRYDGNGLLEIAVDSRYAGSLPGGWVRQAPVQALSGRQGCQ